MEVKELSERYEIKYIAAAFLIVVIVCSGPSLAGMLLDNAETYQPNGHGLVFHPDFLRGPALRKHIQDYSFFGC